ncbi:F0F1 ATP synthase subunit delta [Candidatus Erwinia haradaeae]|uniref:ATP synthase subunit delta n=1 Tax=Candidatus Erwinia haradaeae TaxID=1922217 RepID=A0A451D937_9GAMM|nr:F0F1 ATP synthase subunit delta [Candidatus Erwinia haradaeae]VFP82779.1 ATP synthase subunit delta [Candidatus Erwinia haradaeae]
MFTDITISRPYSTAAFQFSRENKVIQKWQEMLIFAAAVSAQEQIKSLMKRHLAPESLSEKFIKICGNQLDDACVNFIKVIAEHKRLPILSTILQQFIKLRAAHESICNIEVVSSVPLTNAQLASLSGIMEKRLTSNIRLQYTVDKSIIAGVILKTDDMVIDSSVRTRIERLTSVLLS